jgi:hypothetical protein
VTGFFQSSRDWITISIVAIVNRASQLNAVSEVDTDALATIARYGASLDVMPPPDVKRGIDGELVICDGVTRATRVAKYLSGSLITVEVTASLKAAIGDLPTVGGSI